MELFISETTTSKFKEEAIETYKDFLGGIENGEDPDLLFNGSGLTGSVEECSFSNGTISYSISLEYKGEYLGNFSDEIEIDIDLGAEIISYFMKKLGKIKTVLEATKG